VAAGVQLAFALLLAANLGQYFGQDLFFLLLGWMVLLLFISGAAVFARQPWSWWTALLVQVPLFAFEVWVLVENTRSIARYDPVQDKHGAGPADQYVFEVDGMKADTAFVGWFMRSPLFRERAPVDPSAGQAASHPHRRGRLRDRFAAARRAAADRDNAEQPDCQQRTGPRGCGSPTRRRERLAGSTPAGGVLGSPVGLCAASRPYGEHLVLRSLRREDR
jgi:hypothetical protein